MSNLKINVSYAIEDLKINQQKALAFMSEQKANDALKNQMNRLKRAQAFQNLSDVALAFIVQHSDIQTLEDLCRSDDKDSIASYKTAQRIADLSSLLTQQSCVESIKRAFTNFVNLRDSFDKRNTMQNSITKAEFTAKLSKTSAYADNVYRALFFFDMIETTSTKAKNEHFLSRCTKYDIVTIL
jgi:hypothetical protein